MPPYKVHVFSRFFTDFPRTFAQTIAEIVMLKKASHIERLQLVQSATSAFELPNQTGIDSQAFFDLVTW